VFVTCLSMVFLSFVTLVNIYIYFKKTKTKSRRRECLCCPGRYRSIKKGPTPRHPITPVTQKWSIVTVPPRGRSGAILAVSPGDGVQRRPSPTLSPRHHSHRVSPSDSVLHGAYVAQGGVRARRILTDENQRPLFDPRRLISPRWLMSSRGSRYRNA
jgi:hypothetical protein